MKGEERNKEEKRSLYFKDDSFSLDDEELDRDVNDEVLFMALNVDGKCKKLGAMKTNQSNEKSMIV